MMNENMTNLTAILDENNIPYEVVVQPIFNAPQICVPCADKSLKAGDFICNWMSYGHEQGFLECMGFNLKGVVGYLNADQAAEIVLRWYNNLKREE